MQITHKKIISAVMGKNCIRPMKKNIFDYYSGIGVLETKLDVQMRSQFLPWLYNEILSEMNLKEELNEEFIEIAKKFQKNLLNLHNESFRKRRDDLINLEKQKIIEKEVFINKKNQIVNYK